MRRALTLGTVLALLGTTGAPAAPAPPLSHDGRWFTDAGGRAVVLRGFNMVYKVDSYRPADAGFGRDDARFLRRNGFNSIRLGVIYKGLEPKPPGPDGKPRYRHGYLRSLAATERLLARHGIFTMVDFHQDLYNERFQGEGWPDWQTLDDGLPAEPKLGFPANYLGMPALNRAFDHFWANDVVRGRGLQDAYADAWRFVARHFRDRPKVMGYDLLNEPWPGTVFPTCVNPLGCPVFDSTALTGFSERVIAAIREVDRRTLVFWEPLSTFNSGAATWHGDTGGKRTGFSFHIYCLPAGLGFGQPPIGCEELDELVFDNADAVAARTGDVPFLTEFGATDSLEEIGRMTRLADRHRMSWQYWHYCDCSDPTTAGPGVQSVVIDTTKPPRGANVKRPKLKLLARPYPRATAGTPLGFSFNPASRRFQLTYSTTAPEGRRLPRRRLTEVFVPRLHYRDGYRVEVEGARVVDGPGRRVLRLKRGPGASEVSLLVTPRSP